MGSATGLDATQQRKLEQARMLFAKAMDPASSAEESEAYAMKAEEVLARYSLDAAMLAATAPDAAGGAGASAVVDRVVVAEAPYAMARARLLGTIASALRCRAIRPADRRDGQRPVHLFGAQADLDRVEDLYSALVHTAMLGLHAEPIPPGQGPRAFRGAWLLGFTNRIGHRLRQVEEHTVKVTAAEYRDRRSSGGPSVELVLANQEAAIERLCRQTYPRLRTSRPKMGPRSGYMAGDRAGSQASLGQGELGRSG